MSILDNSDLRIGLALSGGGARAMAFHLGCLRALHALGILAKVKIISSVSGGSVLAGMYCARAQSFEEFDCQVRHVLTEGIQRRIIAGLFTWTGVKAVGSRLTTMTAAVPLSIVRTLAVGLSGSWDRKADAKRRFRFHGRRRITRTDLFEMALRQEAILGDMALADLPAGRPDLLINAADLSRQTVFRFTRDGSGTWPTGRVRTGALRLSEAVAASAAFPVLLPSIDREWPREGDAQTVERFLLTDGGVYDNIGVDAFDPTRPERYAFAGKRVDCIIACIAEPGLPTGEDRPIFWADRMKASFASVHRQLHRSKMSNLHQWKEAGLIHDFIMPYLGQDDSKLPTGDSRQLESLGNLRDYPVDFGPMPDDAMRRLIARGETQTRRLASLYLTTSG